MKHTNGCSNSHTKKTLQCLHLHANRVNKYLSSGWKSLRHGKEKDVRWEWANTGDVVAGGREKHPATSLSGLPASWRTTIQPTSVLSAVVQRAVYPANVQLINLWSWPKIEAVQLSAGLWQGYRHQKAPLVPESPPFSFPSTRLMLSLEKRGAVFLFLLLQKPKWLKNGFH